MDRLAAQSTELSNFYVTPLCSPTRSSLLTGRNYLKAGIWGVEGGKDYLNLTETTMADIFSASGYDVIHTGKWHTGKSDGYLPTDRGFSQQIWAPYEVYWNSSVLDTTRRFYETQGWTTEVLGGDVVYHIQDQASRRSAGKPFMISYAPHSIHRGVYYSVPGKDSLPSSKQAMHAPPELVDYFTEKMKRLYPDTWQNIYPELPSLYAELKFIDAQIGRVLDAVENNGFASNTYIMVMGDNGPALRKGEDRGISRDIRIPSKMRGSKFLSKEGGVRTMFYISGPGIPAGKVQRQLASVEDVLPTMVSLAGIPAGKHHPWDGKDLSPVLRGGPPTKELAERKVFLFESNVCGLQSTFIFDVDPVTRRVLKPQPKLDWFTGSNNGKGYARCTAVRYKDYKLMGNKLYRFVDDDNHDENDPANLSNNVVMKSKLEAAATRWWYDEILTEPGSFEKPVALIGHADSKMSQVFVNFAHDLPTQRVSGTRGTLGFYALKGFSQDGDYMHIRQKTVVAGTYEVRLIYAGKGTTSSCSLNLALGSQAEIDEEVAPMINFALPRRRKLGSALVGTIELPATPPGETHELRLWMDCLADEEGVIAVNGQSVFGWDGLHYLRFDRAEGTNPGVIIDPVLDQLEIRGSRVANMDMLMNGPYV